MKHPIERDFALIGMATTSYKTLESFLNTFHYVYFNPTDTQAVEFERLTLNNKIKKSESMKRALPQLIPKLNDEEKEKRCRKAVQYIRDITKDGVRDIIAHGNWFYRGSGEHVFVRFEKANGEHGLSRLTLNEESFEKIHKANSEIINLCEKMLNITQDHYEEYISKMISISNPKSL